MISRRTLMTGLAAAGAFAFAPAAQAQEFLKMATLGPGSSPYMVMNTFAQIVNESDADIQIQVNATGAAPAHAIQAAQGQIDFFMLAPIIHHFMTEGTAMFEPIAQAPELAENLRSLFVFPLGYYHVVTWADDDITSFEDFRGKKVFVGPPGGSQPVTVKQLIEATAGLKEGDYEAVSIGWDAGLQAFQDGRIDVYVNATLPPSPVIEQLSVSRDIRLLGLSDEDLEKPGVRDLIDRPGGATEEIAPDVYGDAQANEEAIRVVASYGGIGTHKDLSDEIAYNVTKAFWEALEEGEVGGPWMRRVSLDTAFQDLNMPLHPGALRYYDEIGLDIPEEARGGL